MLRQRLPNPPILPFISTDEDNEVTSSGVVGVEEVRDYAKETETTREDCKGVGGAEFGEDVLLIFLVVG